MQENCEKLRTCLKNNFKEVVDNIFDIAHADVFERMKIENHTLFLRKQREPGRHGCLAAVKKKLADIEKRSR